MNPILSREFLIPFREIKSGHVVKGIREALQRAQEELDSIVLSSAPRTYENTLGALESLQDRLDRPMQIAAHLISVATTPALREAYRSVLPEFSAFYASMSTNEGLWRAIQAFSETEEADSLRGVWQRHLKLTIQEFRRGGAELDSKAKTRFREISVELGTLQAEFAENVLDSTNAFELIVTNEDELQGLPESFMKAAQSSAEAKGLGGYRFTLQYPSVQPVLQYAERRTFRKTMYEAMMNRAAAGRFDNRVIMLRILVLRREKARLLGYSDFADYRLEINMVGSGIEAVEFEKSLFERTLPYFRKEVEILEQYAVGLGLGQLQPWDTAYLIEKMRQERFALNEEELRPYFPLDQVLKGLFEICRRLFGIVVELRANEEIWDPSVEFYDVHEQTGTFLGSFYTDLFPRESKQAGAWMNSLITGGPTKNKFLPHLGLMAANFNRPQDGKPALLTHREVSTLFHEFGHLLHHLLSSVEIPSRAGTSVARDWVELPSQIMENWIWERGALNLFAQHVDTGDTIPDDLFERMIAARNFMEARAQMRQLSFGAVDLACHIEFDPATGQDLVKYSQKFMEPFSIRPEFAHTHFLTSFSHVFAGGYAAGYYSYKWSEVLDADAFTRFRHEGIFNRSTGRDFVEAVLSRGDSEVPKILFWEFMGREPNTDALFERNLGSNGAKPKD
jgi:oligopeptidase A